jgi:hypothetical protein
MQTATAIADVDRANVDERAKLLINPLLISPLKRG